MAWSTPKTYAVGELLTAADMNLYQRDNFEAVLPYGTTWQTYTPTLTASTTNPSLGSGSQQEGAYYRVGRFVSVIANVRFGTSGTAAGTGTYQISLPINATNTGFTTNPTLGQGWALDASTGDRWPFACQYATAATAFMIYQGTSAIDENSPVAWAASDGFFLNLHYRAA